MAGINKTTTHTKCLHWSDIFSLERNFMLVGIGFFVSFDFDDSMQLLLLYFSIEKPMKTYAQHRKIEWKIKCG